MLVSDGLSDPFHDLQEDANVNGYGLEFYIETPVSDIGLDVAEIKTSWQYQLLFTVCSMAAGHGGIRQIIDHMNLLSTEAEGVADSIPSEFKQDTVNSQSRVGALLGLEDDRHDRTCSVLLLPYSHPHCYRIAVQRFRRQLKICH